jgi:hypothetical protein
LWRVVDFKAISLKIPQEVSSAQAVRTRLIVLLACLRGGWCCGCLLPDVVVELPKVDWLLTWLLTYGWDSCSEFLLPTNSSGGVGVLALLVLFIRFSVLKWYIHRDDQDLAI